MTLLEVESLASKADVFCVGVTTGCNDHLETLATEVGRKTGEENITCLGCVEGDYLGA